MVADAYISRAGIFEYEEWKGGKKHIRRELRPLEEVSNPESLKSFAQVPVTNDHPRVGNLSPKTAKEYMVGATGDRVTMDSDPEGKGRDHVRTSVMVADGETIRDMDSGKIEVSSGYTCDLDETPGVHPVWGPYDAVQRNIRGNHVAIVDSARGGRTVRVRMDAFAIVDPARAGRVRLDGFANQIRQRPVPQGEGPMDLEKLKETNRSLVDQIKSLEAEVEQHRVRADSAELRADTEHGRTITLEKEIGDLKARIAAGTEAVQSEAVRREKERADRAEAQVARFDSTMERRVRERSELCRQAAVVMGPDFRTDDLTDRQIRVAVVRRLDSTADVSDGIQDGVIIGRFLSLIEGHSKNAQSSARIAAHIAQEDQSEQLRADSATQDRKQKLRDQWRQPLPNDIRAHNQGR